ncbi:MAG: dihydropteroate synthase [Pseudomonadota bacterium]
MRGRVYLRPIPCARSRPGAHALTGGPLGFAEIEVLRRDAPAEILPLEAAAALHDPDILARLAAPRRPLGAALPEPALMGVVNVTPDSFSDGGRHDAPDRAVAHALSLAEAGAAILDIGGESTRPGAEPVPEAQELDRVLPVIEGLVAAGCKLPISIDTRKARVARQAIAAGASLFNDVSALSFDPESVTVPARAYCLMHALGDPRTMQRSPRYDDVLLDVYDYLAGRVAEAELAGIDRAQMIVDPGIGFGKTMAHNLALIRGLSLFHGLGCAILLGVSRKRFIGTLSGVIEADQRVAGSIAAGLWGLGQGAQILRVHDVAETAQALRVWQALQEEGEHEP